MAQWQVVPATREDEAIFGPTLAIGEALVLERDGKRFGMIMVPEFAEALAAYLNEASALDDG